MIFGTHVEECHIVGEEEAGVGSSCVSVVEYFGFGLVVVLFCVCVSDVLDWWCEVKWRRAHDYCGL